jgi:vacuolar-type H+-ATPase subunit E/Vma4
MELHLTEAERELLDEVLKERHMMLQHEISHTEHREFKKLLQQRETILEDIIERLDAVEAAAD